MQSRWSFARSLKRVGLVRFEAFNPLSQGISLLAFTLRSQAPLQNRGASRPATPRCDERMPRAGAQFPKFLECRLYYQGSRVGSDHCEREQ